MGEAAGQGEEDERGVAKKLQLVPSLRNSVP